MMTLTLRTWERFGDIRKFFQNNNTQARLTERFPIANKLFYFFYFYALFSCCNLDRAIANKLFYFLYFYVLFSCCNLDKAIKLKRQKSTEANNAIASNLQSTLCYLRNIWISEMESKLFKNQLLFDFDIKSFLNI